MDQVVVAVLSKAVVVIQFEPEGGKLLGNWTLPVEDGVTISEPMILPGDSKSFVVLKATSSDLAVLKLALPGHPSAAVLTVLASFNLTSLTAPYFSGLPLEYSIQLRNNYPSHTLFTCLSDHNRTTYLHRLDLPSFKIEQMGVIQSLNLTGPTSYFLADGVVPLSAPLFAIPSRADAYVALVNTTTLEAYYKETHFPFVPSRGTMFPDGGSTLVVPGGPGAQPDPYAPAFPLGYGYGLSSAPYYFRDGYINGTRPDVIYNPLKNWVFAATYGSQIDYWYYEQTQFNLNLVSQRAVVKAVGSVESLAAWGALYAIGTDESDVVVSQFLLRRK
ncbi:hypothetical protein BJ742DRAFT_510041 [Cladochytrium replicatum]|nr:hypothetical protein BJ742DRAFT_510041 [Cladochytrium replicatum]